MMYEFQLAEQDLDVVRKFLVACTYSAKKEEQNGYVKMVQSTVMIERREKLPFYRTARLLSILANTYEKNLEKDLDLPEDSLALVGFKLLTQAKDQDKELMQRMKYWFENRKEA